MTQASSDARPINELCVEEVLAGHTRARNLERGSIVFRGTATPPKPFSRFYDNDSGNYYTAINWQLQATPCEVDVTLRKIGRNAIGLTTDYANTGRLLTCRPRTCCKARSSQSRKSCTAITTRRAQTLVVIGQCHRLRRDKGDVLHRGKRRSRTLH